jgi:preprotein translocase subunit SecE
MTRTDLAYVAVAIVVMVAAFAIFCALLPTVTP